MSSGIPDRVDEATLDTMERCGGSFVRSLAECYRRADASHRERLRWAFPELLQRYAEQAKAVAS